MIVSVQCAYSYSYTNIFPGGSAHILGPYEPISAIFPRMFHLPKGFGTKSVSVSFLGRTFILEMKVPVQTNPVSVFNVSNSFLSDSSFIEEGFSNKQKTQ